VRASTSSKVENGAAGAGRSAEPRKRNAAVTDSEGLAPLRRCAMKQANVVHRITAAGLMIDAAIVPHHEIAQGPFMTIHIPRRRLVSEKGGP
jgi:hypothetical protein